MDRAPRPLRIAVTAILGYQITAMWSDLPTISHLCKQHPALRTALHAALGYHWGPDEGRW